MVTRKPTPHPSLVPAPLSQAAQNPPYPTTPSTEEAPVLPGSLPQEYSPDPRRSPAFNIKTPDQAPPLKKDSPPPKKDDPESDYSSSSDWERSDDEDDDGVRSGADDIPDPLRIGGGKTKPAGAHKHKDSLPDVLKVKTPSNVARKPSWEKITPEPTGTSAASWGGVSNDSTGSVPLKTNNPYLRMQTTGQSSSGIENSQQAWGDVPSQTQQYGEIAELPSSNTPVSPTNHMANLTLDGCVPSVPRTHSVDQPPVIAVQSPSPNPTPTSGPRHDPNASQIWEPGTDISSIDAWARTQGLPVDSPAHEEAPKRSWQEQQEWEQSERDRRQRETAAAHEAATRAEQERNHEQEFHREEAAAKYTPPASSPEEQGPALPSRPEYQSAVSSPEEQGPAPPSRPVQQPAVSSPEEQGPALSSRPEQQSVVSSPEEQGPALPSRPKHQPTISPISVTTGAVGPFDTPIESPTTVKKRKEHYPIKHIRWYDATVQQIRESPILTQNVNGPCPLLALVNALVLSTPLGLKTEFIETIRTREQVSLGLLVDAVIEELMSGRRGTELGDINELYKFLIGLQTGMNVNPMFVHDPDATDGSTALLPQSSSQPGGFENTRDMRLYRTFNVPLLHGWLPEPGSEAYIAFERVAKTYETSQLVQFQEEELDAKLQTQGLNAEEQRLFTDIHAIKEFLNKYPTQLTDYGLRNMQQAIKPGQIGILFRNDHFSTLTRNPHTNELMTLVTDQGYGSHDEIVWESLVDISGRGSELYSGDFRAVGNNSNPQRQQHQPPVQSLLDIGEEQDWTTVSNNRRRNDQQSSSGPDSSQETAAPETTSGLSPTEQADHDFALALQLQEEEEEQHRRQTEERRRRENALSENAISSESQSRPGNRATPRQSEYPPLIPPRRNNAPTTSRPNNEPAPPPTYEQAAATPQYIPPQGHPASVNAPVQPPRPQGPQGNAPPLMQGQQGGRRHSGRPMGQVPQSLPARPGRRQSGVGGPNGPNGPEERDKCVVM